jgi:hypothetical protein
VNHWNGYEHAAFWLSLAFYVVYLYTLIWSTKRPTISTWLCWLFMDALVLSGMYQTPEGMTPQMIAYTGGTGCIVIACLALRANLGWQWYDTVCLGLTVSAGGMWVLSKDPYVAELLGLAAMAVGSLPLLSNAWRTPEDEPMLAWLCNLAGAFASVLAIEHWDLGHVTQPVLLLLSILFNIVISRQYWPHATNAYTKS